MTKVLGALRWLLLAAVGLVLVFAGLCLAYAVRDVEQTGGLTAVVFFLGAILGGSWVVRRTWRWQPSHKPTLDS